MYVPEGQLCKGCLGKWLKEEGAGVVSRMAREKGGLTAQGSQRRMDAGSLVGTW